MGCWASAVCSFSCWASSGFVFEASAPLAFKPLFLLRPPTLLSLTPLFCCPATCPKLCPELRTFLCLSLEVREFKRGQEERRYLWAKIGIRWTLSDENLTQG